MAQVRLEPTNHHRVELTRPHWDAAREALRIKDFKQTGEGIRVAIVRGRFPRHCSRFGGARHSRGPWGQVVRCPGEPTAGGGCRPFRRRKRRRHITAKGGRRRR